MRKIAFGHHFFIDKIRQVTKLPIVVKVLWFTERILILQLLRRERVFCFLLGLPFIEIFLFNLTLDAEYRQVNYYIRPNIVNTVNLPEIDI